jgi:hypothetical protein
MSVLSPDFVEWSSNILRGWAASSAGRALRSQCRGRGFDPPAVHQILRTKSFGSRQVEDRLVDLNVLNA